MKQVVQNFKTGALSVENVPAPALNEKMVLVENKFSLISSGTEKSTVKVGKANLLNKARQRPDLVAQVLKNLKKEGLKATVDKVKNKLDSPKALGYSTSGKVIASLDSNGKFKPGERVACAGQDYASHAEIVAIPQNLVCEIPDNVSDEEASFTTLGAIALQGVRQANPKLGENICVIGLGLIGQITCQILRANGCNVMGIDIDDFNVNQAKEHSADIALNRNSASLLSETEKFTRGKNFDSVIITAATDSNDPVELSCELLRRKGVIVIVGAVPMNIQREPHFYKKELELKISCSYGPGRYDASYEVEGNDYPIDYVRFTEQRNMEAFLDLISSERLNLKPFISKIFPIDEAEKAYDMVLGKTKDRFTGLLLEYPDSDAKRNTIIKKSKNSSSPFNVGFIGAGSFATSYLIPNIPNTATLETVVNQNGITSNSVAEKFGFSNTSTNPDDIFNDEKINSVFIATRHNTHADYVIKSLEAGNNTFVEKPLCLNETELHSIRKTWEKSKGNLMVGFNRRYSPSVAKIKGLYKDSNTAKVVNIRVNAGKLPKDHWALSKEIGGGRIVGEVCHFVDLAQALTDSLPVRVSASKISANSIDTLNEDNVSITLEMEDGSVANILYTSIGGSSMPKEYIEVFGDGKSCVIEDFKKVTIYSESSDETFNLKGKGHKEEVRHYFEASTGTIEFSDAESQFLTTLVTFKIHDALSTGLTQDVKL